MPADRCPVCDRPHAEEWPAPEGTCGVRAAEVAEQRAAMAAVGTSLGGRCAGETEEVRAAREAPIKALWIAHDEAARANVAAQADCAAHAADWPARCRTAERERDEARLDRDRARAALRRFGMHTLSWACAARNDRRWHPGDEERCRCGLGAAIGGGR